MSSPEVWERAARASASFIPSAADRAARRPSRGASFTAWRCSSFRRPVSEAGRISSKSRDMALIAFKPVEEVFNLRLSLGGRILKELIDLVPIGHFGDPATRVGRTVLRRQNQRPD